MRENHLQITQIKIFYYFKISFIFAMIALKIATCSMVYIHHGASCANQYYVCAHRHLATLPISPAPFAYIISVICALSHTPQDAGSSRSRHTS